MAITVESRAIHLSNQVRDLIITTANIPHSDKAWIDSFLSSALDIPVWTTVHREDLKTFWDALPLPAQTIFQQSPQQWLEEDRTFIMRVVELQLADSFSSYDHGSFHPLPASPCLVLLDWYHEFLRGHITLETAPERMDYYGAQREAGWGARHVQLYGSLFCHLTGWFVDTDALSRESSIMEQLYSLELPVSHSPSLEGVTLREFLSKGIRYACLFPLLAGVYTGVQHLPQGEFGLAFQIQATGAGMTLCTVSTLWIADKILGGIKNIQHGSEQQGLAAVSVPKPTVRTSRRKNARRAARE